MAKIEIDPDPRKCRCGHYRNGELDPNCAERCLGEFSMMQYPPGYFEYKYKVRKGIERQHMPNLRISRPDGGSTGTKGIFF